MSSSVGPFSAQALQSVDRLSKNALRKLAVLCLLVCIQNRIGIVTASQQAPALLSCDLCVCVYGSAPLLLIDRPVDLLMQARTHGTQ